jgi:hypothetical protein
VFPSSFVLLKTLSIISLSLEGRGAGRVNVPPQSSPSEGEGRLTIRIVTGLAPQDIGLASGHFEQSE